MRPQVNHAGGTAALGAAVLSGFFSSAALGVDADRIRQLLDQDCGSCHGLTRKGGLGSSLEAAALAKYSDDALVGVIMNGLPGTAMPPWKAILSEEEARVLVRMLRTEARP